MPAQQASVNRQITLARRPRGRVTPECFAEVDTERPEPADGEALVRIVYLSIDPTIRGWMERDTYLPAIKIGEVIRSAGLGQVIESRSDTYPEGAYVFGLTGWQDYAIAGPASEMNVLPDGIELTDAISMFGATGLTAYFGLLEIGALQEGDVVLVSGAAGGTGSVAGQLAKLHGSRTIGIAGSDEKCEWLTNELGFDGAINYKTEDVSARIGELCPDGVDVFYDNVGGDILEAALDHLALKARIVMCGAISTYNDSVPRPGPSNLFNIIVQRARMEGFILLDYIDRFPEAALQLAVWAAEGKLKSRVDLVEGLEHAPDALDRLFTGANIGKVIVKVSSE